MPDDPVRKILHIDMDAFYASVEQRDDPALRGRPVVVAWRGARSVVCAASYEARRFGIRSAMPALRAERLCPDAVFVPPDFNRYRAASRQVREIFHEHAELVEPLSLDEAYLDVTTNLLDLPSATAVAESIRARIREATALTASAGVAPAKFLAKIASDWNKPDGIHVIRPHQVHAFLEPLPVAKIHGVGRVMESRLHALGIRTAGDLARRDLVELERHFGRYGLRLHELAHGIDRSEVRPHRPVKSVSSEDTFASDLPLAALAQPIQALAAKTWAAYRRGGRGARTVVLKLKTAQFQTLTRSQSLSRPVATEEELVRVALDLRTRVALPESTRFRLVGVGLAGFDDPDLPVQENLFSDTE